jgi:hypothetical protein
MESAARDSNGGPSEDAVGLWRGRTRHRQDQLKHLVDEYRQRDPRYATDHFEEDDLQQSEHLLEGMVRGAKSALQHGATQECPTCGLRIRLGQHRAPPGTEWQIDDQLPLQAYATAITDCRCRVKWCYLCEGVIPACDTQERILKERGLWDTEDQPPYRCSHGDGQENVSSISEIVARLALRQPGSSGANGPASAGRDASRGRCPPSLAPCGQAEETSQVDDWAESMLEAAQRNLILYHEQKTRALMATVLCEIGTLGDLEVLWQVLARLRTQQQ